ncbi:hypothetical protein KSF78_0007849 [Schistosoma japonicum]|nr:hypothetical protein KSF78_0007849 [Schistosoma japonicum]
MLLITCGFVLLNSFEKWYHVLMFDSLTIVTTIVSVIIGGSTENLSVKWRKILFGLACLFTLTGIIFIILGFVCRESDSLRIAFQVVVCASWCCVMFIVKFWSTWYLVSRTALYEYTFIFKLFLIFCEYVVLNIILKFAFAITGCVR